MEIEDLAQIIYIKEYMKNSFQILSKISDITKNGACNFPYN